MVRLPVVILKSGYSVLHLADRQPPVTVLVRDETEPT